MAESPSLGGVRGGHNPAMPESPSLGGVRGGRFFKLSELTRSATAQHLGIDNIPSEEAVKNLSHLVWNVLDPLRKRWGSAIIVNSGFRCEALNKAVGGAKASYHRLGMAADIRPRNGRLAELYDLIHAMFREGKLGLTECYLDGKKGYIHIAYDVTGFNTWPFEN